MPLVMLYLLIRSLPSQVFLFGSSAGGCKQGVGLQSYRLDSEDRVSCKSDMPTTVKPDSKTPGVGVYVYRITEQTLRMSSGWPQGRC
jgi:hypothetical protein